MNNLNTDFDFDEFLNSDNGFINNDENKAVDSVASNDSGNNTSNDNIKKDDKKDDKKDGKKGNKKKLILIVLLLLVLLVVAFYSFFNKPKSTEVILEFEAGKTTSLMVKKGDKLSIPSVSPREGYEFVEWQLNGKKFNFDTPITENLKLVAIWRKKGEGKSGEYYTVTFDTAGGNSIESQKVEIGEKVIKPENPTKEPSGDTTYTFTIWTLDGKEYNFNNTLTEDITLVANWVESNSNSPIERYTVSFNSNEGSFVTSQIINKGDRASKPHDPMRNGYSFAGWELNGRLFDFNTPINSNVTLTARWESQNNNNPTRYTVSFNSNGGSSVASQTVSQGGRASKPQDPTRSGYTFAGWEANGGIFDFNTPINSNVTLTAKWNSNTPVVTEKVTVSFDSSGGSIVGAQTINKGSKANSPANPTKIGYNFAGWSLNGQAFDFNSPVNANITLVANWSQKTFTVKAIAHDQFSNNRSLKVYADGVEVNFAVIYYTDGVLVVEAGKNNVDLTALESTFLVQLPGSNERFRATLVS